MLFTLETIIGTNIRVPYLWIKSIQHIWSTRKFYLRVPIFKEDVTARESFMILSSRISHYDLVFINVMLSWYIRFRVMRMILLLVVWLEWYFHQNFQSFILATWRRSPVELVVIRSYNPLCCFQLTATGLLEPLALYNNRWYVVPWLQMVVKPRTTSSVGTPTVLAVPVRSGYLCWWW